MLICITLFPNGPPHRRLRRLCGGLRTDRGAEDFLRKLVGFVAGKRPLDGIAVNPVRIADDVVGLHSITGLSLIKCARHAFSWMAAKRKSKNFVRPAVSGKAAAVCAVWRGAGGI